jgi:hypothetical protein
MAYPGNWINPYVGKVYDDYPSTEVVSMGLEQFASPRAMAQFYLKDKEHFALTLGIIESLQVPEHLKPTSPQKDKTPSQPEEKPQSPLDTKLQGWNFFKKEGKKPETLKTPPLRVDLSKASKEFNTVDNLAESKVKEYDLDSVPPFIRERYQGLKAELAKLKPEQEEESRKIHAEMDSLHKVSNDILESKMQALTNELLGNNVDTDSILKGVKIKSKDYDSEEDISEKYPEDIEIAKKYLADFHRMTNGKMANLIPEVEVVSDGRSWAYDDKNSPETENFLSLAIGGGLSDNIARGDTFHESAHLLEMAYPEVNRLAQEFLTMTRDSDKLYRLSDLMPDRGYDDDELAYTDKWVAPYVGKVYEDSPSTEVISVGFEYFASPQSMAKLYVQDKEHFKLILGVLQYISRLKRPTT